MSEPQVETTTEQNPATAQPAASAPTAPAPTAEAKPLSVWEQEQARLKDRQWIPTFTGGKFAVLQPQPAMVKIEDIAHALANKCRFTGQTRKFYSVAEHSVHVSKLVPATHQLSALLHDSAEAYLPDIASPYKSAIYVRVSETELFPISQLEDGILTIIFMGLGIPELYPIAKSAPVKRADLRMLATEVRDIVNCPDVADFGCTEQPSTISVAEPWTPEQAKAEFLKRFAALTEAGA